MEKRLSSKRGQELSIGTLILIVLGIIVLVLLVLGFSIGWKNLFGKIGIVSGSDLSTMVAACEVAVSSQATATYCEFKKVRIGDEDLDINCEYSKVKDSLKGSLSGCPGAITDQYVDQNTGKGLKKSAELMAAEKELADLSSTATAEERAAAEKKVADLKK